MLFKIFMYGCRVEYQLLGRCYDPLHVRGVSAEMYVASAPLS